MEACKFPHLFSPYTIKKTTFKNRIFTAPAGLPHTIDPSGFLTYDGVINYAAKARGGAAVVTLNEVMMRGAMLSGHSDCQINIQDIRTFRTLNMFSDYVHAYGGVASAELIHCGNRGVPQFSAPGDLMGPSAMVKPNGVKVREMTVADMEEMADAFADAARICKEHGFDMVLLHGGHGWIFTQFLSPLVNHRTDEYGGSLENRARFPIMVLDRIREAVGPDMLIEYRYSVTDLDPGGMGIEESCQFIKMIEDKIDLIQCSVGGGVKVSSSGITHPTHFYPNGCNVYLSEAVKKAGVKIPVVAIGAINDPALADEIIREGKADFVTMVRTFIADSDWGEKARLGRVDDIRPCIKCLNCLSSAHTGQMKCSVNPHFGREVFIRAATFPTEKKKVCVVGGGPAGMQAALQAAERGHQVTLYEGSETLGGQLKYAEFVSFKDQMKKFCDYLIRQIKNSSVDVRLGVYAVPEKIREEEYDAVIVALGAQPMVPPIPGADNENVLLGTEAFHDVEKLGRSVVIVGGGMVGCELALHLHEHGKSVTLLEMGSALAPDAGELERKDTIEHMQDKIDSRTGMRCTAITPTGVVAVDHEGREEEISADTVVLATGMRPDSTMRDSFLDTAPVVRFVGDCVKAATLVEAIHTGFDAGHLL